MSKNVKEKVHLAGLDIAANKALNERIEFFEANHEADVVRGGPGWVPRLKSGDYLFALVINIAITLWLIISLI